MNAIEFKVCGLTRPGDARAAQAAGATYGGVILAPGSPRTIDAGRARELFAGTTLVRCGVFVNEPAERLARLGDDLRLDVLQLHGDETPEEVRRAAETTGLRVWKAIRPRGGEEFARDAERYAPVADGLLVDGWSDAGRGGTGARFPWEEVAAWRDAVPVGVRLIVAGGLTPENVAEAIARLDPDVVDVSSGVESSPGVKESSRIEAFAAAVAGAPAPFPFGRASG